MENGKLFERCKKCNRPLKSIKAKQRGYGDYCWYLHRKEETKSHGTLFNICKQLKK